MKKQISRVRLTAGRVDAFTCPADKPQAFLWDTEAPTLALRATPTGRKTYVFESRLNGATIRITIGTLTDWPIEQARLKAQGLKMLVDSGTDPREVERDKQAAAVEKKATAAANALTVGEAWSRYTAERRPFWGDLNIHDHESVVHAGGQKRTRSKVKKTIPGVMAELLPLRLIDLTAPAIEAWAAKESKTRPARVRLALRLLKAFLRWAANEPDLKGKADPTAASAKKTREIAGKAKTKNDYLQREQLPAWFEHVRQLPSPVISAYLQCLLLTGARREELAALRWEDVNFQWRGMDLKDKIEGNRPVPLTPYVQSLIERLPRANEWVFSSARFTAPINGKPGKWVNTSESGRLIDPSNANRRACAAAGLDGLTLHGLRRSFASLCEWLDIPGGISAQIQGHAPQGVREQNYIRRPLDLLRVHHEKIEAWILEQAGIKFDVAAEPGKLRVVA